ncbi:hypothetical protein IT084_17510 [Desulfallas sp. Bu1-1]|uniref:hypothetical protein n=1 Tax=Desulfallas sp. Bu1-1 TaxID=2787620 RepID=UPI00189D20B0|nr:hypothetical protein [Desulfallas sp. Bu1-1]MBF7084737.1 hypothetical protein [Desulfallas sp. Bu1-1]
MNLGPFWIIVLLIAYTPIVLIKYSFLKEGGRPLSQVILLIFITALFVITEGIGDYLLVAVYDLLWIGALYSFLKLK